MYHVACTSTMNEYMTIGEILCGVSPRTTRAKQPRDAHEPPAESAEVMIDDGAPKPQPAHPDGDTQTGRTGQAPSPSAGATVRGAKAAEGECEEQARPPGDSNPQATVLHHLERMTLPSVALANRMADEFEAQMEQTGAELKYARQRANLAWSAVAFMALVLLYLGWWTGGSIEGSRATARSANETVQAQRQQVASLTNELGQIRRAAEHTQTAERTRSLELIQKLEQSHQTILEMARRTAEAERGFAEATATIARLEQQVKQLHAQLQTTRRQSTAPEIPSSLRDMVEIPGPRERRPMDQP